MHFIHPQWPAPKFVKACTSCAPIDNLSLNHSMGLKDSLEPQTIKTNRQLLEQHFQLKNAPWWLNQTHSATCKVFPQNKITDADASITRDNYLPLAILTADCLPILICHQSEREIAAIHAGWRGLYQGIIENTFQGFKKKPQDYLAWLGPAICQSCYEVNETFRQNFIAKYPEAETCFSYREQWHFSLSHMADNILKQLGVQQIFHSNLCTFENPQFYSYRRDQGNTGRIASLIWMEEIQ